jgi:hypothetical protein
MRKRGDGATGAKPLCVFNFRSELQNGHISGKSIPGIKKSQCKGHKVGTRVTRLRRQKGRVAQVSTGHG